MSGLIDTGRRSVRAEPERVGVRCHRERYACCDPLVGELIRASKTTAIRYERDRPGELVHVDVPTPTEIAEAAINGLVASDAATVGPLAERWVPQLSAKRVGLDIEGTVLSFPEILADHQVRRNNFGAIVVDGSTYNFRINDQPMVGWYIAVVPIGFPTADGAFGRCLDEGIDRASCVATLLSDTVFDNTLRLNP